MDARTITLHSREYRDAIGLYRSAFPEDQRFSPFGIWLMARVKSCVTFTAYYDEGLFCGISYTVDTGRYLYIYYLATSPEVRSQGYGSRILRHLKESAPDRTLMLDAEAVEPSAPNYAQRLSRVAFYQRNGFTVLDHYVVTHGKRFDILATDTGFDADEYWSVFRRMSQPLLARWKQLLQLLHLWR